MPPAPSLFIDPLDDLQSRYDGRPPNAARLAALVGGAAPRAAQRRDAARRLCAERCTLAWQAVAQRRAALAARQVRRDRWLARLVAGLMEARMQALQLESDHLVGRTGP